MDKSMKNTTGRLFTVFSLVPVIVFCIVAMTMYIYVIIDIKIDDTKELLQAYAKELSLEYDELRGDESYRYEEGGYLFVGDELISNNFDVVDRLKSYTGVDVSVFWKDERIQTTIRNNKGMRIIGTKSEKIWADVVSQNEEYFDKSTKINGTDYFAYYAPLYDADGSVVGMVFAGITDDAFHKIIYDVVKNGVLLLLLMILIIIICVSFAKTKIESYQRKIVAYLVEIDKGDYKHTISPNLLKRSDEFGRMANTLVNVNDSLENLVYKDPLTDLYNRRALIKKLEENLESEKEFEDFTFTICDIDHFKKVNDTYGHNCGDEVLKLVAGMLKKDLPDEDYMVARWGGEEFVIIQKGSLEDGVNTLEEIADNIRNTHVFYEQQMVSVTMTFGITQFIEGENIGKTITRADELLYQGKSTGRNKIVS